MSRAERVPVDTCRAFGTPATGAVVPCGTCGAQHRTECWIAHATCDADLCDGRPVARRAAA